MERVRLYPSPSQERRLRFMLHQTRHLYNALLDQRRYVWTARRRSVTTKTQYTELTALRRDDPALASVYRECEDAVLHRLDLAMQAFFRRVKRGETPGYPRFKPASRWRQIEFQHGDRALKMNNAQTKVRIPGVGTVPLRKGRSIPDFGRAFVVERNGAGTRCSSVIATSSRYRRRERRSASTGACACSPQRRMGTWLRTLGQGRAIATWSRSISVTWTRAPGRTAAVEFSTGAILGA